MKLLQPLNPKTDLEVIDLKEGLPLEPMDDEFDGVLVLPAISYLETLRDAVNNSEDPESEENLIIWKALLSLEQKVRGALAAFIDLDELDDQKRWLEQDGVPVLKGTFNGRLYNTSKPIHNAWDTFVKRTQDHVKKTAFQAGTPSLVRELCSETLSTRPVNIVIPRIPRKLLVKEGKNTDRRRAITQTTDKLRNYHRELQAIIESVRTKAAEVSRSQPRFLKRAEDLKLQATAERPLVPQRQTGAQKKVIRETRPGKNGERPVGTLDDGTESLVGPLKAGVRAADEVPRNKRAPADPVAALKGELDLMVQGALERLEAAGKALLAKVEARLAEVLTQLKENAPKQ